MLFERGVPARKFATTQVDVFDEHVEKEGVMSQYERKMSTSHSHDEAADRIHPDVKTV